jgi:hypothetical protein
MQFPIHGKLAIPDFLDTLSIHITAVDTAMDIGCTKGN